MGNLFFATDELFDSHAHLNDVAFATTRAAVLQRAEEAGVAKVIDIAVDVESSRQAVEDAKEFKGKVFAAVGIDPEILVPGSDLYKSAMQDVFDRFADDFVQLRELISANPELVVAIGETGIDDYWIKRNPATCEMESHLIDQQQDLFTMHLQLAQETKLPLSIHSRGAEELCLKMVKKYPDLKGVFHSYTGDYQTAMQILDAGWGLGVNGIVTFNRADDLRRVYHKILGEISSDWSPADFYAKGIYFETDAPYLAPEGKRGEVNEPANVRDVFDFLRNFQQ